MRIKLKEVNPLNSYFLIFLLIAIYLLINIALPLLPLSSFIRTYIMQPIIWGLLAWVIIASFPEYKTAARLKIKSYIIQLALIMGFSQILFYVIGGLFSGFGKSPYSFTPLNLLINLIFVSSMLIGMEFSRAWLLNSLHIRNKFITLILITALYTLLSIPLIQIIKLELAVESFTFFNSTLLPLLAENLLASLLAMLAGPLAAIAYRGMLQAFWWFCPILPDLSWAIKSLIGTAVPIIGIAAINDFYTTQVAHIKLRRRAKKASLPFGWIITTIFAVAIIWFSIGLFPIHPTVIVSNSMKPSMSAGDIAIIVKTSPDLIEQGDIVQFTAKENITVLHRVIDIHGKEDKKLFITKGDANEKRDTAPLSPSNIVGKTIFTVPKLGWASIAVKQLFSQ